MDQFGHQEMLESLSQGSGKKTPSSSGSHQSKKSSSSSGRKQHAGPGSATSTNSAVVNEAYRRQGLRLSYLAHGEVPATPPEIIHIQPSSSTAFDRYDPSQPRKKPPPASSRSSSIMRILIFEAKYSFPQWEDAHKREPKSPRASRKKDVNEDSFEATTGLSQLSLQRNDREDNWEGDLSSSWRGIKNRSSGEMRASKGLLSAVLEGHSDSNTSASGPHPGARSTHTSPSQSISTKDSRTVFSSSVTGGTGGADSGNAAGSGSVDRESSVQDTATDASPQRGVCLTVPSQPTSNAGLDNIESNLILHENDAIKVPRKSLHTFVTKDKKKKHTNTFRVQKLLGQGTFAQVFQCLHEETGEAVAMKIVKSKPAYTRQATVEIDVFRALNDDKKKTEEAAQEDGPVESAKDYMVNMICYFMHRSHLCLVFQLLGLNLYEVLKQRQFRGLPLTVVRSMVKQSLMGVKELSQRSIVHCDLKPENILIASDDTVRAIVNSGETTAEPSKGRIQTNDKTASDNSAGQSSTSVSDNSRETSDNSRMNSENSRADTIVAANHVPAVEKLEKGVKLIDFGSACFEGYTAHTYIQSRFYRSPEVVLGLPYDSAIDMWSLGCVAAELLLGLPLLPGVHEHDQLSRIEEMIAKLPDWMLDQGSKSSKYYVKYVARPTTATSPGGGDTSSSSLSTTPIPTPTPPLPQWRLKSLQEYVRSLSKTDIEKRGGLAKLGKPPGNRYFRKKTLLEILRLHSATVMEEDKTLVIAFAHFLHGLLDPDPWKRWTAFQAVQHPFITGQLSQLTKKSGDTHLDPKETNLANLVMDYYWKAPWDPAICRRKLLNVQKLREKQQAMRRSLSSRSPTSDLSRRTRRTELSTVTSQSSRRQPSPSADSSPPRHLQPSVRSKESAIGKVVDTTPPFPGSSSMSSFGRIGESMHLMDGSVSMQSREDDSRLGPQSYTSGVYEPGQQFVDADFAYALQRPGVVPANSVQGSYASSVHMSEYMSQSSSVASGTAYPQQYGRRSPHSFAGVGYHDQSMEVPGTPAGYASTTHLGHDYAAIRRGSQFGGSSVASSASSVTTDTNFYSSGPLVQGQMTQGTQFVGAQQHMGMLSPQQQFGTMPQLSMQGTSSQGQSQYGMVQGGPVIMQQQAPVVTQVQAPDGGFYFVMTSPTGQAMLLQPVSAQQMPLYGGQPQSMPLTQQFQSQPNAAPFVPQQNVPFAQPVQMQQTPMMQSGIMGVPQGQSYPAGAQFSSAGVNQQQLPQTPQFFQPQMQQQQQQQQQPQQQFYQPPMQQQQQHQRHQQGHRSGGTTHGAHGASSQGMNPSGRS